MQAICLDIDNVIAHTDEVLRRVIRDHSKLNVDLNYEDVVCFDYWKCRDPKGKKFPRAEWAAIHTEFTRNHIHDVRPMESIQKHLDELRATFEIHLVTSRLPEARDATVEWAKKHQIPHTALHFAKHAQKHLVPVPFVAVVEDDREQAYAFRANGVPAFLLAHPWNEIGPHSPLSRLSDWTEVKSALLQLG